jgi:hypothetical protein
MLRVARERRAWVLAALVVLIVGAVLWFFGAPYAKARAERAIGARLGMVATIGELDLSMSRAELRGVELRGLEGGLTVRIEKLTADVNALAALFKGAGAVGAVRARAVDVDLDLADAGAAGSLSSIRNRLARRSSVKSDGGGTSPSRGGRAYDVSAIEVDVADASGPMLSVRDAALVKEGDRVTYFAEETLLGELDHDHVRAGPLEVTLERSDGVWVLDSFELAGGRVRSMRDADTEQEALALRVRAAIRTVRGSPEPTDATDEPSTEPVAATDEPSTEPVFVPAEPTAAPASSRRLFSRLAPDAEVKVRGVDLESRTTEDGRIERIRGLDVSLNGRGDGWFRIEANGETTRGGVLTVDMSVHPDDARAEGSIGLRRLSLALIAPFVPEVPFYEPEVGSFSAELELVAESTDRIAIEGGFRIEELGLFDERIAADPIEHVGVAARGKGAWHPNERRLEIELATVRMNDAQMMLEGEVERTPEHYRVDLTAKLPPTDCNDVVSAIPRDVLRSLSRFRWVGNWSALTHLSLDSRDLQATELSIRVRNLCEFTAAPKWVAVERFQEPFRHRVVEPDETVFRMRTGPTTDNWVAFEEISPFVVPAVISHEDGGFFDHGGFAPWAIRDALVRNLEEGRYVVGASTISMQLAKNLYLKREKTIARKAQEVLLTWWLESQLTKEQILELYLNVIEYAPGVYGLRNAAAYYFGREPIELSPAESAFLACVLPSPKNYYVSFERGKLTRPMKNRSKRLLEHMAKRERIGPDALAYGLAELEDFQFRKEGDPPPSPRILPPLGAPEEPLPEDLDPYEALFLAP